MDAGAIEERFVTTVWKGEHAPCEYDMKKRSDRSKDPLNCLLPRRVWFSSDDFCPVEPDAVLLWGERNELKRNAVVLEGSDSQAGVG